jgi:hypothetical protein
MTQTEVAADAPSSLAIVGSATLAIELSRTAIERASQIAAADQ